MRRREFILGVASLAAPGAAVAQQKSSRRIALVAASAPSQADLSQESPYYGTFFGELRRFGYTEGQNLIVDRYSKEQLGSGLDALAALVTSSSPDVVILIDPSTLPFVRRIRGVSIVTIQNDPVANGFAQSLARPGGSVTGVSVDSGLSIHSKRIALLREVAPAISRLASISVDEGWWEGPNGAALRSAAQTLGVTVFDVAVDFPGNAATYRNAILQARSGGADAIIVVDSPDTFTNCEAISGALAEVRIPAIQAFAEAVEAGGLMAYSFDLDELIRRMAATTDAILRGANPGEIPFYQVSKFELAINLKAARALGLTIPTTLLATADRVVE